MGADSLPEDGHPPKHQRKGEHHGRREDVERRHSGLEHASARVLGVIVYFDHGIAPVALHVQRRRVREGTLIEGRRCVSQIVAILRFAID